MCIDIEGPCSQRSRGASSVGTVIWVLRGYWGRRRRGYEGDMKESCCGARMLSVCDGCASSSLRNARSDEVKAEVAKGLGQVPTNTALGAGQGTRRWGTRCGRWKNSKALEPDGRLTSLRAINAWPQGNGSRRCSSWHHRGGAAQKWKYGGIKVLCLKKGRAECGNYSGISLVCTSTRSYSKGLISSLVATARRRAYFPRKSTASAPSGRQPIRCTSCTCCTRSGENERFLYNIFSYLFDFKERARARRS